MGASFSSSRDQDNQRTRDTGQQLQREMTARNHQEHEGSDHEQQQQHHAEGSMDYTHEIDFGNTGPSSAFFSHHQNHTPCDDEQQTLDRSSRLNLNKGEIDSNHPNANERPSRPRRSARLHHPYGSIRLNQNDRRHTDVEDMTNTARRRTRSSRSSLGNIVNDIHNTRNNVNTSISTDLTNHTSTDSAAMPSAQGSERDTILEQNTSVNQIPPQLQQGSFSLTDIGQLVSREAIIIIGMRTGSANEESSNENGHSNLNIPTSTSQHPDSVTSENNQGIQSPNQVNPSEVSDNDTSTNGRIVRQRWMVYLLAGNNPSTVQNLQDMGLDVTRQHGSLTMSARQPHSDNNTEAQHSPTETVRDSIITTLSRTNAPLEGGSESVTEVTGFPRNIFGQSVLQSQPIHSNESNRTAFNNQPNNENDSTSAPLASESDDHPGLEQERPSPRIGLPVPESRGSLLLAQMMAVALGLSSNLNDYESLMRLAEMMGPPVRPRNANEQDVQEQLDIVRFNPDLKNIHQSCMEKCCICLEPYQHNEPIRVLKCKHGFHKECVDEWLVRYVNSCPMCRSKAVETKQSQVSPQQNASDTDNNLSSSDEHRPHHENLHPLTRTTLPDINMNRDEGDHLNMNSNPDSENVINESSGSSFTRIQMQRRPDLISHLIQREIQNREIHRRAARERGEDQSHIHDSFIIILNN